MKAFGTLAAIAAMLFCVAIGLVSQTEREPAISEAEQLKRWAAGAANGWMEIEESIAAGTESAYMRDTLEKRLDFKPTLGRVRLKFDLANPLERPVDVAFGVRFYDDEGFLLHEGIERLTVTPGLFDYHVTSEFSDAYTCDSVEIVTALVLEHDATKLAGQPAPSPESNEFWRN